MSKSPYNDLEVDYGFQLVLSTIPNQEGINFEEDIEKHYFANYKERIDSTDLYLYRPLKFYMLGSYDVCYITLIDSFKFSHRLFEPKGKEDDTVYNDHAFQCYSGFALNDKNDLERIFSNPSDKYFVGIINLKLNNGLLIGNGLNYIEAVIELIKEKLGDTSFLIFQTLSWFEISLIIFIDETKELSNILSKLRLLENQHLNTEKYNLGNSLYNSIFRSPEEKSKIERASVFSDTHTYLGFNENLIKEDIKSDYFKEFKNSFQEGNVKLKTRVEWHVKPGHILDLENILKEEPELNSLLGSGSREFVLGKSDYSLKQSESDILSNIYLIRYIINSKGYCKLFKDVRRVKSFVYLDANGKESVGKDLKELPPLFWLDKLNKLCITSKEFHHYDKKLKSLKISRQVRNKILKIFSNYNNGIQNPILFPYFLDFTVFIENLKHLINHEYQKSQNEFIPVRRLEKKLNENIKVFQEGYNVRFLNGYHFENISDFDLDFNSSIQQLLTSYGTLVYEYGKYFYSQNKSKVSPEYAPIIQLNDIDTVSNDLSINYSVHHLTSPEFVFATILKELLNHLNIYNDNLSSIVLDNYYKNLDKIKAEINESYLDDMFDSELIEINYFIIDSIRFALTFNFDFDLFAHWFWTYNFQNSALFNTSGMINEYRLKMELFRIMIVKNFFGISKKMKCPSPEIYSYWKRHYDKIDKISKKFIAQIDKDNGFKGFINDVITKYYNNYSKKKFLENKELSNDALLQLVELNKKVKRLKKFDAEVLGKFIFNLQENKDHSTNVYFIDDLMWTLLINHYQENKKQITTMRRDWKEGDILPQYKEIYSEVLYSIDQMGGVFLSKPENRKSYFKYNAMCLLSILDFSLKQKREFISSRVYENN